MRFEDVVATSAAVAEVSGRLDKIGRLAALLARLSPDEVAIVIPYLSGETRQGRLGVGYAVISSAADVAPAPEPSLEVLEVDAVFDALARVKGKGAAADRARLLRDLFARATRDEQDFLRRLLYGELRQGALEGVLIDAIARAANVAPARLRRAVMMSGNASAAGWAALSGGDAALDEFAVTLMRPVRPMLAESEETVDAALEQLGDTTLEFKLDGARIQVHKKDDDVRIFSRTLRDVTAAAPEVVSLVRALPARELIVDGEVLALNPDGTPKPFQVTMRRFGRTRDVDASMADLPLTPVFFDCVFVDGATLLDEPLERRTAELRRIVPDAAVTRIVRPTLAEAIAFADLARDRGHEGVMAKALASPYAAGRRGGAWLKIKRARTLDLVVLAAEWGHGRRRGTLSNLHLGARDPDRNNFVMLGKTFKGMTDEMLRWQTSQLLALEISRDEYTVFVRPELVVEIAYNDIQESPVYPGGLALRFARVKRYRTDKTANDADTIQRVKREAMGR
jgi:DNA ligase-1